MARLDRLVVRSWCGLSVGVALVAAAGLVHGCGSSEKPKPKAAVQVVTRDVPQVLRGTVGAEATFRGIDPTLVAGLGLVVGLAGTGGGDLDISIQTTMEREIAKGGIGKGGIGVEVIGPVTPQEFLRSKDVAVVIVEARIPPGAPEGTKFDLHVRTLPGSGVTSIEGGTLWTTDMRLGPAGVFGAVKARKIAEGKGAVSINPFSDPSIGPNGELTVTRTSGRVLNGGTVTDPLQIEMVLDNDSFSRARTVVQAINGKFPRGAGDDGQVARGRGSGGGAKSYQSMALRVPHSYADNPAEFLQLVRYMRVDQSFPQEYARQYVEALKANPGMAEDVRWLLQSLGKVSLPFIAPMYEYPEFAPRMAVLAAGARLGDARTVGPLMELAKTGSGSLQVDAIRLLGDMPRNPSINLSLRELLGAKELDVKVAVYEALRKRDDPAIVRIAVGRDRGTGVPKFTLDLVPILADSEEMIYVTQQGEPRVVLFGGIAEGGAGGSGPVMRVEKPHLVTAWGERFMMAADSSGAQVRIRFVDPRTNKAAMIEKAPEDVAELIRFLAHKTTPEEPKVGLNFSYSEVVGALYEMTRQGAIGATFSTEADKLRAEIFEASQAMLLADRPEGTVDPGPDATVFKPTAPQPLPAAEQQQSERKSKVVPLNKPKTKVKKS